MDSGRIQNCPRCRLQKCLEVGMSVQSKSQSNNSGDSAKRRLIDWLSYLLTVFLPAASEVWGKVVFSQASLSPQVGCGRHPPRQTPGQTHPRQTHPLRQTPHPGQTPPLPRDGHWSGRYASYWNAFLFQSFFVWGMFRSTTLSACRNFCNFGLFQGDKKLLTHLLQW